MTSSRAAGQTRGCGAPRVDRTTEEGSGLLHRAVIAGDSHTGGAAERRGGQCFEKWPGVRGGRRSRTTPEKEPPKEKSRVGRGK